MNGKRPKSVLVTGGANGIGEAVAKTFLRNGYPVTILDVDKKGCQRLEKWAKKQGFDSFLAIHADITDLDKHSKIISNAVKINGPIGTLINNTGIGTSKSITATKPEDYDAVWDTNIRGPFFLTQQISKRMRGGNIIFVTSVHQDKPLGDAVYAMSKSALKMLIREFALSLAVKGIRVNGVALGAIRNNHNVPARFISVPLGECRGTTEDIAKAIFFLTSPEAAYITGEILTIDGGLSLVNWLFQKGETISLPQ